MTVERSHLLLRAAEGFDLAEIVFPLVDKRGCMAAKTNLYSVPVKADTRVEARMDALHVEVWHAGHWIARYERCHSRRQQVLDLEHYLDRNLPRPNGGTPEDGRHRQPNAIRVNNGPEYISGRLKGWAEKQNISLQHIQPNQPQ